MDKEYWKKYYSSNEVPPTPSPFAIFILENFLNEKETLIEFGCGNGRDSIFFANNNINVIAIDQCKNEINKLKKENHLKNLKFIFSDFTKLDWIDTFDNIYSRFTLHAIKEEEENSVIDWAKKHLNKDGKILIEARGLKNELFGLGDPVKNEENAFIYDNHYRRFIDLNKIKEKLEKNDFEIILAKEEINFAPFKNENQKFIRIIGIKK